jgi:hypothetical protein
MSWRFGRGYMFKNLFLLASLLANCLLVYIILQPMRAVTHSDRMTCEQARSEIENKKAVDAYAEANSSSLNMVHSFLTNSDYQLRNIDVSEGKITFVYTSSAFYPSSCGVHVPGFDGGIVRLETDIVDDPKVVTVR